MRVHERAREGEGERERGILVDVGWVTTTAHDGECSSKRLLGNETNREAGEI